MQPTHCLLVLALALAHAAHAQLPIPRLQTVFPPGGTSGSTIQASISGTDLDGARHLLFSSSNITATIKTNSVGDAEAYTIALQSNTPPGIYEVRVAGRFGISNPRGFAVGDLPEITQPPTNTSLTTAAEIPKGTVINGRVDPGSYAYFQFHASAGERLIIECADRDVDSRLASSLILYDGNQIEIARNRRDGFLDFTASSNQLFTLRLNDFLFRGGQEYVYRLLVSTRPHVDFVFPLSGQAGATNQFTIYGRNLPGSTKASDVFVDGRHAEKLTVDVPLPSDASTLPLAGRSIGMGIPDVVVDALEYRWPGTNGFSNPVLLGVATAPITPREAGSKVQMLTPPCEVVGRFAKWGVRDTFEFKASKDEAYWIEVYSDRLGFPADPFLLIQKLTRTDKGEEQLSDVKELNDSEPNFGGAEYRTSSLDPATRFVAPETGSYRVHVRDLFSHGKAETRPAYRLSIRKENPDFRLVAVPMPNAPPKKDSKDVAIWSEVLRRGQTMPYRVLAFRRDGFAGEITLRAEGLPAFVTCAPASIAANSNSTLLLFTAATNAQDWAGPIRILGQTKVGERELTREARGATLNWSVADNTIDPTEPRLTQQTVLGVCGAEAAPLTLLAGEGKTVQAVTNSKVKIPIKVDRNGDWTAALKLKPAGLSALDSIKEIDLAAKATSATLEIDLAKQKLPPGNYSFHLQSQAQGKYQNDPEGAKKATAAAKEWEEKASSLAAALKKADEELKSATKSANEADTAAKAANDKLAKARTAAELPDASASAKSAIADAQKSADKASKKAKATQQTKQAAEAVIQQTQSKLKDAEAKKVSTAARAKELAEKSKPKDATIYVYSPPVQLKVVEKLPK